MQNNSELPSLHICMVTREFPPNSGGIGYYVYNLSKGLTKKGHKVSIITRGSPRRLEKEVIDGIDLYKATFFPVYPFHMPLHGLFVNSLLKSLRPEVSLIHLHSPLTPSIKTSVPIVLTIHTPMKIDAMHYEVVDPHSFAEKMQSRYFTPFMESQLLKISNVITAVSPSVAKELSLYGVDPKKIPVVWNGVDEKVFTPAHKPKKEKYILYTGGLRARKGLPDLIRSVAILKKTNPDIKLIICGTGPLLPKLKEQVRNLDIEKNVEFLGRVDRATLIQAYQNAALQVVPSIYEGLPTVLLEGMSCELPVVATNIEGSRDLISTNENGVLVPPRCPTEMALAIARLWMDEVLRKEMGKKARETVLRNYTWERIVNNFIQIYENALRTTTFMNPI